MKTRLAIALFATAIGIQCTTPLEVSTPVEIAESLQDLRMQYTGLESIHVRATGIVSLPSPTGPNVTGSITYEYWSDGQRYRAEATADPALGLMENYTYAFDGTKRYVHDKVSNTLSIERDGDQRVPTAIPNPIFLPLDFLRECEDCAIHVADAKDPGKWARQIAQAVKKDARTTVFQVGNAHLEVDGNRPTKLDRFENGRKVGSAVFSDHATINGVTLPRKVSLSADGMTADFVIDVLQVNEAIDPTAFTISDGAARSVWNGESRSFTKSQGSTKLKSCSGKPQVL